MGVLWLMYSAGFLFIFTCVVEQTCNKGAVPEEGMSGGDVFKVTLFKHRVFKHHGLHP